MTVKIFINYRRDDSIGMAGRLHDRLAQTFGRDNLFMDVDHIPVGTDFVAHLNNQVTACDVFLVVIGSNWLYAKDESGGRRLDNPEDFVAIEIAVALARDIRVIPVLVDGARMPKATELPDSLKPLARRQAAEVRHAHFGRDAEALIERVREALGDKAGLGRWRVRALTSAAAIAALLLIGVGGYSFLGHIVDQGVQRAELKLDKERKAAEAEANRKVMEAANQAEQERQARAAHQAEEKRKADEAEQQRLAAVKAEQDSQARAAQQAEEKRKADEAEQQRLAAIKAEQERQAKVEQARVDAQNFFQHGLADQNKGDYDRAIAEYTQAIKLDPDASKKSLGRTLVTLLADGLLGDAIRLAEYVVQVDTTNAIARLVLGVGAIKQMQYPVAGSELAQSVRGPVSDLTAALLSAWAQAGAGDSRAAVDTLDKLSGPDWYGIFKELHAGLILDLANDMKGAGKRFANAYKADSQALRTVQAYGRYLSRTGNKEEALKVYADFAKLLPGHPVINQEIRDISAGVKLPPLVESPQAGAAEALYGLGASIGRRGGQDLALIYLQLALYLEPTHPMALLSLGDLYDLLKKPDLAIKAYERIPVNSVLARNAQIQTAVDLDALDRTDEAKKLLERLIAEHPNDTEAIIELGNIQRARKN